MSRGPSKKRSSDPLIDEYKTGLMSEKAVRTTAKQIRLDLQKLEEALVAEINNRRDLKRRLDDMHRMKVDEEGRRKRVEMQMHRMASIWKQNSEECNGMLKDSGATVLPHILGKLDVIDKPAK